MSHELGTEARVIQDLRAEITKREKNDYDFSNETFFLPRGSTFTSQLPLRVLSDYGETSERRNRVRELRRDIPISTFS